MDILVLGSGGREHALVWKISKSSLVKKIYCAPGNAGIKGIAECVDIKLNDFAALIDFVKKKNVDLTVVGPEIPLSEGIVDAFSAEGLRIFGPNKLAAQFESSKAFSKDFMQKYSIPTAKYAMFTEYQKALDYIKKFKPETPLVVKADGLAAGKGVTVAKNIADAKEALKAMMETKLFGAAGSKVVIEECLVGEETSIMAFMDGKNYSVMVSSQDHKRVFDNDEGPNTGGMGAYAPAPVATQELLNKIEERVFKRFIDGTNAEGIQYKGVLYAGIMVCNGEPYVIEFNCRFGDPETQVVLPLLKTDIIKVMNATIDGGLDKILVEWYNKAAVSVVLSSGGYPINHTNGYIITGLNNAQADKDIMIFHAGTVAYNGDTRTSGGRVLAVTAVADNIKEAISTAYRSVEKISFEKMHYRKDIGKKAINRITG